ncbi:MAG: response regulator [Pseudonocardiaceae bacterium]
MTPLRVVVADDHPIYRSGLRVLIAGQADLELVGQAATGPEAIDLVESTKPDIVLMDITMPGIDGIAATRHITAAHPQVKVLMLTMLADGRSVLAAIQAGASGYLVKGAGGDDALRAIRSVAAGEVVLGPEVASEVLSRLTASKDPARPTPFPDLTGRERDILDLLAQGYTNTAIADRLFLGQKTVRNYVSSIFRKLQVTGRVDAVIRAREAGLG